MNIFDWLIKNVTGHGIDNHLCALEVFSRQQLVDVDDVDDGKRPELFTEPMWKEMMRFPLTTSQVLFHQTLTSICSSMCR